MNDWIAMAINVGYIVLAGAIIKYSKIKFLNEGWTANFTTMCLVSIFVQFGILLFDIPIGFFGFNNPERIAEMKERWWLTPGVFLSPLLCILSCRVALVSFSRSKCFGVKDWHLLSLSSFLFSVMMVCIIIVAGIGSDTMALEDQQFILDYWWGFGLFFGFIHFVCSLIVKGVVYVRSLND